MADPEISPPENLTSGAKTSKSNAESKKPTHPPTSEMVNNAIKSLNERGGSSLQAIKKYVFANFQVDPEKISPFIKKYLKGAVANDKLIQTKGKGANGSFKIPAGKVKSESAPKKAAALKKVSAVSGEKKAKTTTGEKSAKTASGTKKTKAASGEKKAEPTTDEKKAKKAPSSAKEKPTADAKETSKKPSAAKKPTKKILPVIKPPQKKTAAAKKK